LENFVKEIITTITHSIFFFEYRVFYGVIWKNVVEPDRPHMAL